MTKKLIWLGAAIMTPLLALLILWQFRIVVVYVLISLALAAAMRPLITRILGRGFVGRFAWILACLVALFYLGYALFLASSAAMAEIQQLAQVVSAQDAWKLPIWLQGSSFQRGLAAQLPPLSKFFEAVLGLQDKPVLPTILGFTQSVGDLISGGLGVIFLSIYWSLNQIHFERLWLSLLPSSQRKQARDIWRTIEIELGAYIRSEMTQSLLAALLLGVGYWLLGSPYPALMALTGALAWLIPVVGAPLAIILPLMMGLFTSVQLSLVTALYTLFILFILEVWVEPRIFKRRWNNPIVTLVILLAMADTFGILGILVAPPLSSICHILWDLLVTHPIDTAGAVQVSDLRERQERLRQAIQTLDEPPEALVTGSMERLGQLIDKAEPILEAGLPKINRSRPVQPSKPIGAKGGTIG